MRRGISPAVFVVIVVFVILGRNLHQQGLNGYREERRHHEAESQRTEAETSDHYSPHRHHQQPARASSSLAILFPTKSSAHTTSS